MDTQSTSTPPVGDTASVCVEVDETTYLRLQNAFEYDAQNITKHTLDFSHWLLSCLLSVVEEVENVQANGGFTAPEE